LTAFTFALVSNAGEWPCGEGSTIPGDIIFMSAEDGIQDTIIPRLMATGADTTAFISWRQQQNRMELV
jgi:putative DNA primase/helicase